MPSTPLPALTRLSIPFFLAPALMGCASVPPIVAAPSACSTLVPSSHRVAVPGADLPSANATAGDWVAFGDAQTGQLDKANGHTADVLEIIDTCEKRDAATLKAITRRPWWKLF